MQLKSIGSIDKRTLDEQVYDSLSEAIMGGHFEPGQPITLRGLADTFGTSLMPVRSAVSRLAVENVLVAVPNRSITVPRLSVDEFDEMTRIRMSLESLAAEIATLKISDREIDDLEKMDRAMIDSSPSKYFQLNTKFHFTIYEAAASPVLLRLIKGAWLRVGPLLNSLRAYTTEIPNTTHNDTVVALRKRDPVMAARSIADDIGGAAGTLRKIVAEAQTEMV